MKGNSMHNLILPVNSAALICLREPGDAAIPYKNL
jgi:hypothetical protein